MSIRINREAVASIVQSLAQRAEEATYQGPRSISDKDVLVTLPLGVSTFEPTDYRTDSDNTIFNAGNNSLTLRLDFPDDKLPVGKFARLVGFTYNVECIEGDATPGDAAGAFIFEVQLLRPEGDFIFARSIYQDTIEMSVTAVTFPYAKKAGSFSQPILFPPESDVRFKVTATRNEEEDFKGRFQVFIQYVIVLSDIPLPPTI